MIQKQFKKLLTEKGLTQKDFAAAAGVDAKTVGNFFNGKNTPTLDTLLLMADALDCEIVLLPKGKAEQPEIPLDDDNFGHILISAVRYAIGRQTYMPGIVQEFIHPLLPYLSGNTLYVIERDIREAPTYGHETIDKPGWMELLAAIHTEQRNR